MATNKFKLLGDMAQEFNDHYPGSEEKAQQIWEEQFDSPNDFNWEG